MRHSAYPLVTIAGLALAASTCLAADQQQVSPELLAKIEAALPQEGSATADRPRRLLIFSKTNGYRHPSIPVGAAALKRLGEKTGAYSSVHSEDDAMFQPEQLQKFDAVLFLNTTGDVFRPKPLPEDADQRQKAVAREKRLQQSLLDFVRGGKGLAGIHAATDTYHRWKEFTDMMGGTFAGHPWHMDVPIRLLDPNHPLNKVFGGEGFTIRDEIYQFRDDTALPSERKMLLSLDPDWEGIDKGDREDGFYPISWIDRYGDGRTFYCSLGHRDEIYHNPLILEHYLAGMRYVLGDLAADAEPAAVPTR